MKLFSNTFTSLNNALTYSSLKQKVISENIANVDTPNYKAKDVRFKTVFQNELNQDFRTNRSDGRHLDFSSESSSQAGIVVRQNVEYNNNGNSVDIDQEMSDLATNQIYFNALVDQLNSKFSTLQNVIRGGK